MTRAVPVADRLWSRVDKSGDCWLWTGGWVNDGYGRINLGGRGGRAVSVHRLAYELLVGPIPSGKELDHLCRNRACVNPAHLEPVDRRLNILRGVGWGAKNAQRASCKRGHPLLLDNLVPRSDGRRECRTCKELWNANRPPRRGQRRHGRKP